jgi:hypothetical protein
MRDCSPDLGRRRSPGRVAVLLSVLALLVIVRPVLSEARVDGTGGKQVGFMVATPSSGGGSETTPAELQRVAATGANSVGVTVYWATSDDQSSVAPEAATSTDLQLRALIRSAGTAGLKTMLHLMLHCPSCPDGWRGQIAPADRGRFYQSYSAMVAHYATIAAEERVATLFIGSEMNSLQEDEGQWRNLVATARRAFPGTLAYEVNWDSLTRVKFWDALDLIGVSAYFPLTDEANPSVAHLNKAWMQPRTAWFHGKSWVDELGALSAATGRRIMFGEVGYRSISSAAARPFETTTPGSYSPQAQSNAMESLLLTFENKSWFAGVTWWDWYLSAGLEDTGFTPRGKLAEEALTRWWSDGWRPSALPDDGRAPAGSTTAMTTRSGQAPVREGTAQPGAKAPGPSGVDVTPAAPDTTTLDAPLPLDGAQGAVRPSLGPAGESRSTAPLPLATAAVVALVLDGVALQRVRRRSAPATLPAVSRVLPVRR